MAQKVSGALGLTAWKDVITAELSQIKEELSAVRFNLEASEAETKAIERKCKEALDKGLQELRRDLMEKTEQQRTDIDRGREIVERQRHELDERIDAVDKRIEPRIEESCQQLEEKLSKAMSDLQKGIVASIGDASALAESSLQRATRDLQMQISAHDDEVRKEISKVDDAWKASLEESFAKQKARIDEAFEERRILKTNVDSNTQRLQALINQVKEEGSELVHTTTESLRHEKNVEIKAVKGQAERSLEEAMAERWKREEELDKKIEAAIKKNSGAIRSLEDEQSQLRRETSIVRRDAEKALAEAQEESKQRMVNIEDHVRGIKADCSESLAVASSIGTRQIEWRIENSLDQLHFLDDQLDNDGPQRSWFSPKFDVAGTRGLQLELRMLRPRDRPQRAAGDCSLYLWAAQGLQLVFRLFLGSESTVLRHTFDEEAPCGVECLCFLADQVSWEDGSLRLGVEVLEALREVRGLPEQGSGTEVMRFDSGGDPAQAIVDGLLVSQQYFNHRLLELIQSQGRGLSDIFQRKMDVMRSRAVRRVQWRLEQGSLLRQRFLEGKAVCSTAFRAAGINGLQFVFYPSGCTGARQGFCSFFVLCPAECSLRCWLWAGRWRREARPEPSQQKGLLGRVNFARFETCLDPVDESVELALEIEEANQVETETSSLKVESVVGGSLLNQPTSTDQVASLDTLSRLDVSTLKLDPSPPKGSKEQVKQLPAIWTAHGFQTFGETGKGRSGCGEWKESQESRERPSTSSGNGGGAGGFSQGSSRPATRDGSSSARVRAVGSKAGATTGGFGTVAHKPGKYKEYSSTSYPLASAA